jgi:Flp pilus assembly protein CpaB
MTLLILGGGTLGTLLTLGYVDLPWARRSQGLPEGMVAIPISARPIPQYTRVERGHLMNPETGEWVVQFRRPEEVPAGVLTSIADVRGRVTAREKPAGFFFVEEDFFPKGTRPGVVAGVPPGKRALTLEVDRLKGVRSLRAGDHIDMLASIPIELLAYFGGLESGWRVENALVAAGRQSGKKRTETRMLASDAVVVEPVTTKEIPIASNSLTQGTITRRIPVQEIVIAVEVADVSLVAEAVDQELAITCVACSGRPDDEQAVKIPEGMVEVPVAARYIPAYSRLVRDDVVDTRTRVRTTMQLSEEEVERLGIVRSMAEVVGRVAARDLSVGEFFTQEKLLDSGSGSGVAAGIPPGKRSFTLDARKVTGAHTLGLGDHFDLLASIPLDWSNTRQFGTSVRLSPTSLLSSFGSLQKQAEVRVVINDGVVVAPVVATKLNLPARLSMSEEAVEQLEESAEQMIVAVAPEEVARLAEAVALELDLVVICRSADTRPSPTQEESPGEVDPDIATRGWNPMRDMKMIETMVGNERQMFVLPASSDTERLEAMKPAVGNEPPSVSPPRAGK